MDRRQFLKAVAAAGIGTQIPVDWNAGAASDTEISRAWAALDEEPLVLEVINSRTLAVAGYPEPTRRSDTFNLSLGWLETPHDLAIEMRQCPPLAWAIAEKCEELKYEALDELEERFWEEQRDAAGSAEDDSGANERIRALLDAEEGKWPSSDDEEGMTRWVESIDEATFKDLLEVVREWLDEEPDWVNESDFFSDFADGQSTALSLLRDMDPEVLEVLGIAIVEGECPGSTYYAAELEKNLDEANAVAVREKIPIRFVASNQVWWSE